MRRVSSESGTWSQPDSGRPALASTGNLNTIREDGASLWRRTEGRDTLRPALAFASAPGTAGMMTVHMVFMAALYTPLVFLVFRCLGGERGIGEPTEGVSRLRIWLDSMRVPGFLPYKGRVIGVYAPILRTSRGPSITMRNRSLGAYVPVIFVLAYATARYRNRTAL